MVSVFTIRNFFSERKMIFAYLAIWYAIAWVALILSSSVELRFSISDILYPLFFYALHLGLIEQLHLFSKGESPTIQNGFKVAQRHFFDLVLVVIFAVLYSIVVSLPLMLVAVVVGLLTNVKAVVLISTWLVYPLFVFLVILLYEVGIRVVIFHGLPSNHAVKYAFRLIRQNLKSSLKALLSYFFVGFVSIFFVGILMVVGFLPYISNPDLKIALRLYAENQYLGFVLSIVTFFILSTGLIFSTSLMNAFFVKITDKAVSLKAVK